MQVKVPNKIGILAHQFEVKFKANMQPDYGRYGDVIYRTHTIRLDPLQHQVDKEVSFWHEVLHGIGRTYSLGLEEATIERLSEAIVAFNKENFGIELDFSELKDE